MIIPFGLFDSLRISRFRETVRLVFGCAIDGRILVTDRDNGIVVVDDVVVVLVEIVVDVDVVIVVEVIVVDVVIDVVVVWFVGIVVVVVVCEIHAPSIHV